MYSHLEKRLQDYSNYKDFIKQVVYLENVDSTNNYALSMNPKEEGVFIIANLRLEAEVGMIGIGTQWKERALQCQL